MSNVIVDKTFDFAVQIVKLCARLRKKNDYVISHQLLKSATSIGANVEEAQGGISKKDFRAKISIAFKESKETMYWLRLLEATNEEFDGEDWISYKNDLEEILKILNRILVSTRE